MMPRDVGMEIGVSWRYEMVIWDDGMEWWRVMVDGMVVCIGGVEGGMGW